MFFISRYCPASYHRRDVGNDLTGHGTRKRLSGSELGRTQSMTGAFLEFCWVTAMADARKTVGSRGEAETVAFLETRGYLIVDTNVRPLGGMARGEIDVVAWDGEYLVFCEVKTRRVAAGRQGTPAEAVHARKQAQLTRLAWAYIAKHELDDVSCRFDVVEVVRCPPAPARFTLLRNAFPPAEVSE